MTVGEPATKQTWLLDNVEVRGIVWLDDRPPGETIALGHLYIVPDEGYEHLVNLTRGSNGRLKCETYPLPSSHSNRQKFWPLPDKPEADLFMVHNRGTGVKQPLKIGDHVQLVGRWTIDHHPENSMRWRGLLAVGYTHSEMHPFHWDKINLIADPPPDGEEVVTVSVAAPIHEESYLGLWWANWWAGVSDKVFVDNNNFHHTVRARVRIAAPRLPRGWTYAAELLSVVERVIINGTGWKLDTLRSIKVLPESVEIFAVVTAPRTVTLDSILRVASINDPAHDKSVLQAQYVVRWRPRLVLQPVAIHEAQLLGETPFVLAIKNVGPDPVKIDAIRSAGTNAGLFAVEFNSSVTVASGDQVAVPGAFSPAKAGRYSCDIEIASNDPTNNIVRTAIAANTAGLSGRLRVRVSPAVIKLGRKVEITVSTDDTGSGVPVDGIAKIRNYSSSGGRIDLEIPTNRPSVVLFRGKRVYDAKLKQWESELPSGTATVPGYEKDADIRVPFKFN